MKKQFLFSLSSKQKKPDVPRFLVIQGSGEIVRPLDKLIIAYYDTIRIHTEVAP